MLWGGLGVMLTHTAEEELHPEKPRISGLQGYNLEHLWGLRESVRGLAIWSCNMVGDEKERSLRREATVDTIRMHPSDGSRGWREIVLNARETMTILNGARFDFIDWSFFAEGDTVLFNEFFEPVVVSDLKVGDQLLCPVAWTTLPVRIVKINEIPRGFMDAYGVAVRDADVYVAGNIVCKGEK